MSRLINAVRRPRCSTSETYLGVLPRHDHALTPACDKELAELTIKEEYLMRFWWREPDVNRPE